MAVTAGAQLLVLGPLRGPPRLVVGKDEVASRFALALWHRPPNPKMATNCHTKLAHQPAAAPGYGASMRRSRTAASREPTAPPRRARRCRTPSFGSRPAAFLSVAGGPLPPAGLEPHLDARLARFKHPVRYFALPAAAPGAGSGAIKHSRRALATGAA